MKTDHIYVFNWQFCSLVEQRFGIGSTSNRQFFLELSMFCFVQDHNDAYLSCNRFKINNFQKSALKLLKTLNFWVSNCEVISLMITETKPLLSTFSLYKRTVTMRQFWDGYHYLKKFWKHNKLQSLFQDWKYWKLQINRKGRYLD